MLAWFCCSSDAEYENAKIDSFCVGVVIMVFIYLQVLRDVLVQILKNTTGNKRGGGGPNPDASL